MTDRYRALVVMLERPIRSDDIEPLVDAIRLLRDVELVEPVEMDDHATITSQAKACDAQLEAIAWHRKQIENLIDEAFGRS